MSTRSDVVDWTLGCYHDLDFGIAREWLEAEAGRTAAGYLPVYAPREIIHACSMLPV